MIPNWDGPEGFQHYKDRTPRWIKNYTELLHDDAYLRLTLVQRGVLHGLWMEYASARRQIPDSTLTVSRRLGQRVTRATLDSLNHAGFIAYSASRPLAERYQPASPEKRREEKNTSDPPSTSTQNVPDGRPEREPIEAELADQGRDDNGVPIKPRRTVPALPLPDPLKELDW